MSLQDRLDAFRADFEGKKAPPEAVAAFHKATAELVASGQAERALKAGDRAPAFTLPDADGMAVSSTDLLARGPLVLTFYRGVWCPYCNLDLQAIEAAANEIRGSGASLAAISPQTPANSRRSQRDNKLRSTSNSASTLARIMASRAGRCRCRPATSSAATA